MGSESYVSDRRSCCFGAAVGLRDFESLRLWPTYHSNVCPSPRDILLRQAALVGGVMAFVVVCATAGQRQRELRGLGDTAALRCATEQASTPTERPSRPCASRPGLPADRRLCGRPAHPLRRTLASQLVGPLQTASSHRQTLRRGGARRAPRRPNRSPAQSPRLNRPRPGTSRLRQVLLSLASFQANAGRPRRRPMRGSGEGRLCSRAMCGGASLLGVLDLYEMQGRSPHRPPRKL
jgi:hypothetical protein